MKKTILVLLLAFHMLGVHSQRMGINTNTPLETLDVRGNVYVNNNLGIGITNPQFPLSFSPALGDKISLWGNSGPNYGFGIQSYLLQIHTDGSESNIAFGYGSSASFTERMRIKGNGNVGIGITNPLARLHITDSNVVFSAAGSIPGSAGNVPVDGAGRRMLWYADKAAFRAGYVDGSQWDKDSIGIYSFAAGFNSMARGNYSIAMGYYTKANDHYSTAMGHGTSASGEFSTAMGWATSAGGIASTDMGLATNAKGGNSTAFGNGTTASGYISTAMGVNSVAQAYGSCSIGTFNDDSDFPHPVHHHNDDRIFQIGNGISNTTRRNAMTVLRNGNTGIGILNPTSTLDVMRGTAPGGTAQFRGTNNISHFNFGSDEDTYIRAGKNNRFVIINDIPGGKVGIGTSTPGFALNFANTLGDKISLWGNSGNHYGLGIQSNLLEIHTADNTDDIAFGFGSSGALTERMRIKGNGNVGIGTSTPDVQLCVNGSIKYAGYLGACSDIRYKKDLAPISNSLHSILSLSGFYYSWKQNEFPQMEFSDKRQIGFSAQEMEKLFPELVMTDANGYKSVDYGRLTPVLVEAIKEQQEQITKQQQQIDELRKMVEKLINR